MSGPLPCVVVFNYDTWVAQYPEFAGMPSAQAQGYFNQAALYCDNTASSVITDASPGGARETILYMLTAHVATILAAVVVNGTLSAPSPLVGRITNATEGSVTVAAAMDGAPGSAAWFNQTKYGAMAWQAMAPYRTMRYAFSQRRYLGVQAGPFGPNPFGFGSWGA